MDLFDFVVIFLPVISLPMDIPRVLWLIWIWPGQGVPVADNYLHRRKRDHALFTRDHRTVGGQYGELACVIPFSWVGGAQWVHFQLLDMYELETSQTKSAKAQLYVRCQSSAGLDFSRWSVVKITYCSTPSWSGCSVASRWKVPWSRSTLPL